jgi:hypothetical protein
MNVSKSRRRAGGVLVAAALAACGGEGVTRAVVPDAGGGDAAAPVPDAAPIAADATPDSALAEIGLTIEAPVAGQWVNTRRFEVRGRFTGPAEAIDVNGVAAVLDADTYRAFVTLPPGPGLVTVTAGGTIATVDVTVDPVPPRIDLTTPLRGTWVSDLTSPLAFGVTDDNGLTGVYLNERRLPGAGPDFSLDAPLCRRSERSQRPRGRRRRQHRSRVRPPSSPVRRGMPRCPSTARSACPPRSPRPCSGVGAEIARYIDDLDLRALLPEAPSRPPAFMIDHRRRPPRAHDSTVALDARRRSSSARHVARRERGGRRGDHHQRGRPTRSTICTLPRLDVTGVLAPNVVDGEIRTGVQRSHARSGGLRCRPLTAFPSFGGRGRR